jgi:hypothetical protein
VFIAVAKVVILATVSGGVPISKRAPLAPKLVCRGPGPMQMVTMGTAPAYRLDFKTITEGSYQD